MIRQELARLTNIQDTVRKYVSFTGQLQSNCPFHKGPNPTFIWNPKKGTYKCQICEAHGDIVDFVMKMEDWTYFKISRQASPPGTRHRVCTGTPGRLLLYRLYLGPGEPHEPALQWQRRLLDHFPSKIMRFQVKI